MKKFSLFIIIPFFICDLNAQITLTNSDMPEADDVYFLGVKNNVNIDASLTGADYIWDFSDLIRSSTQNDTFVSIFSTNVAYNVIFNPLVANLALKTQSPPGNIPNITIEENYDFYKNTSSSFVKAGFGAEINGVPTPVKYSDPEKWFDFPLTYQQQTNSESVWGVPIPTIGYYGQTINRVNTVDGWGTLIIPYGTFQVLRVKSEISIVDTLYYENFGFGTTIPRGTSYEYNWYAQNEGISVLKISETAQFMKTAYFKDSLVYTQIKPEFIQNPKCIINNPVQEILKINNIYYPEISNIKLISSTGKCVLNEKITESSQSFNINSLSPGVYFWIISNTKMSLKGKVVIQNY